MSNSEQKSQPSEKQIREFWERCGFRQPRGGAKALKGYVTYEYEFSELPNIDLNNLFKYAVPKLLSKGKYLHIVVHSLTRIDAKIEDAFGRQEDIFSSNNNLALALFWAIWEVIKK